MKNSQINRVVRLISQTGDKAIIFDQETDNVVVMMPLDSYEGLVGADTFEPDFSPFTEHSNEHIFGYNEPKSEEISVDDLPDFGEPNSDPFTTTDEAEDDELYVEDTQKKNPFAIPSERLSFVEFDTPRPPAEELGSADQTPVSSLDTAEKLDDIPHEDEEEKFYLEPVE